METLHCETNACAFLHELKVFHQNKGSPFRHLPAVNGRTIDLYKLYNQVTSLGGWKKVSANELWHKVLESIDFPTDCANSISAVKEIYARFLNLYEKIHFHGEDPDDSSEIGHQRSLNIGAFPLSKPYNYAQHEVSVGARAQHGLSALQGPPGGGPDYAKLCRSLGSGLPNEQELALNVCTLLSNDSRNVLHLERCPHLVDLLLAQVGIWPQGDETMRSLYLDCWKGVEGRNVERFWADTVHDPEVLQLWPPHKLKYRVEEEDLALFNLGQQLGAKNSEQQRILRVALILHNLSFERHNIQVLARNDNFLRFVLLCCHCRWAYLRQVALDTLGNLAPALELAPEKQASHCVLLRTVREGLSSPDRLTLARSLEILARLSQRRGNAEALLSAVLDPSTCSSLVLLLSVCDVMLLLYVLEALYSLTDLGQPVCERLLAVRRCIEVLVNLLTVESPTYGSPTHAGIKLVEVIDPSEQPPLPPHHPYATPPPFYRPPPAGFHHPTMYVPSRPSPCSSPHPSQPLPPRTPDLDPFTCNWLLKNFEMVPGHQIIRNDMYAEYIAYCGKTGHKAVNAAHFITCVKSVFPHSGQRKVDTPQGSSYLLDSIRRRVPIGYPPPTTPPPPAQSPILKAHLSSVGSTTPPSPQRFATPPPPPPPGSSLIKSLLASKLSRKSAPPRVNGMLRDAVQLEVCAQAEEARNLVGDLPYQEAHIERVQNHALLLQPADELDPKVSRSDGEQSTSSRDTGFGSESDANATSPKPTIPPATEPKPPPPQNNKCEKKPINGLIESYGPPLSLPNGVASEAKSPSSPTDSQSSHKIVSGELLDSAENSNLSSDLSTISDRAGEEAASAIKQCSKRRHSIVDEDETEEEEEEDDETSPPEAKRGKALPAKDVDRSKQNNGLDEAIESNKEGDHSTSPPPDQASGPQFFCDWKDCLRGFSSGDLVIQHVAESHLTEEELVCLWGGQCDGLPRRKLSLLTHLQDRHCSATQLRPRNGITAHVSTPPPPVHLPEPAHVAIRKSYMLRDLRDEREGPLTKSIRLTSALVLRNLCIHSSLAKRYLKAYEHQLLTLAASYTESARTVSQCLYELCQPDC